MEWISVKDELPVDNQVVLAWANSEDEMRLVAALYLGGTWVDIIYYEKVYSITYWLPIPTPPGIIHPYHRFFSTV